MCVVLDCFYQTVLRASKLMFILIFHIFTSFRHNFEFRIIRASNFMFILIFHLIIWPNQNGICTLLWMKTVELEFWCIVLVWTLRIYVETILHYLCICWLWSVNCLTTMKMTRFSYAKMIAKVTVLTPERLCLKQIAPCIFFGSSLQ